MSLMPYDLALEKLINHIAKINKIENVSLLEAHQRILAENIIAQQDAPLFDNSAMDGYAICGLNDKKWMLIDSIAAGEETHHLTLKPGTAVRILTGAAIPKGTDAVIAQEDISIEKDQISCSDNVQHHQHIRFQAEEYAAGDILFNANQRLNAAAIGVAASQGLTDLKCYQKLKISVFSSGNELQSVGEKLKENQIYDSNLNMLVSCLDKKNYLLQHTGILPDQPDIILDQLKTAASESDVVIISGGASVGDKDYTKAALENLGEIQHWKLAIKPGKPFAWGTIEKTMVFLLPGNPVASWVTFHILVKPALHKLAGVQSSQIYPNFVQAIAQFELNTLQSRQQFLRGTLRHENGKIYANINKNQGSAMLSTCAMSNAFIIIPANSNVKKGQVIQTIYLSMM